MRISPITGYNHVAPLKPKQNLKNITFTNAQTTPLTEDDFNRANEYCKKRCNELKECARELSSPQFPLIHHFDLDKLNGIQYGIDLFDGMTMKEVAFVLQKPSALLNRGCPNLCSHCFANALPSQQLEGVKAFTYEDFQKLCKGISEVKKRIEEHGIKLAPCDSDLFFYDSDCIEVEIKDKNNNLYDMVDCFEILRKNGFTTSGQYDTSGWTPTSTRHQQRAEKFVKYVQDTYKDKNIKSKPVKEVMVSINPFHSIYQKYIDLRDSDFEKAKKYRDLYINRMANVLYTFSPLLDIKNLNYILNFTVLNSNPKYDSQVMNKLIVDILSKLDKIYDEKGTPKVLKHHYVKKYTTLINNYLYDTNFQYRSIGALGRAKDIMPYDNRGKTEILSNDSLYRLIDSSILLSFIEPNGRVEAWCDYTTYPTDIQLNLSKKYKPCPPLGDNISVQLQPNDAEIMPGGIILCG